MSRDGLCIGLIEVSIKPIIYVYLYDNVTNRPRRCRALLDTGSDSFVWCRGEQYLKDLHFQEDGNKIKLSGLNNADDDDSVGYSKLYSVTIYFTNICEDIKIILPKISVAVSPVNKGSFDLIIPYTFLHQFDFMFTQGQEYAKYGAFNIMPKTDKMVYDVVQSRALVLEVNECTQIPEEVKGLL